MFKAIYKGRLGGAYSSLTKPKRPFLVGDVKWLG